MTESKIVVGPKHLYTLLEGEQWTFFKGNVIIVHPDREPKIIDKDGNITSLRMQSK